MFRTCWVPVLCVLALSAGQTLANEGFGGKVTLRGSEVHVVPGQGNSNVTISVSGPNGFHATVFSKQGSSSIDLIRAGGTADGQYTYEITAATSEKATNKNPLDNGRGGVDKNAGFVPVSTSGSFYASGGIIKEAGTETE